MTKHTEGPWVAVPASPGFRIYEDIKPIPSSRGTIAKVIGGDTRTPGDAALIAAAPELLAACEAVVATHTPELSGTPVLAQLIAAIAKARGEP